MKRINTILVLATCCWQLGFAQTASELQSTAKSFMQQGDYANAVLVLNRAIQMEPKNIEIIKDLSMGYYLQKDNNKALELIKTTLDREDADDQSYQIAGIIYQQMDMPKECEKLYRKGLKRFPVSGPLYNDLADLLYNQKDYTAIKLWEKGIELDPDYSKNYYNACKYYYASGTEKIWSILYGEIFVNMEPLSSNAPEIKSIITESYKKLFTDTDISKDNSDKNRSAFANAFIETMNKQSGVAGAGINPESLTMIRTRFILDWEKNYEVKFPFRLFDLQKQLLQDGLFDAYNQWLFGAAQNLAVFQNWTLAHATEYSDLNRFQKGRVFKISAIQYYRY
ncbi:MAG: tetratricopeptide repeat protein [Ferruginibacter sp.]|jgi:tetratricopeptide (TPR) repeat protein